MKYVKLIQRNNITVVGRIIKDTDDFILGENESSMEVTDEVASQIQAPFDENKMVVYHEGSFKSRTELPPPQQLKDMQKAVISKLRWQDQYGGITLPNQMFVRTDESTRSTLTSAMLTISQDPTFVFQNWKLENGTFIDLDAATITLIYNAVLQHTADVFAKEKSLCEAIDNATTIEEVQNITW